MVFAAGLILIPFLIWCYVSYQMHKDEPVVDPNEVNIHITITDEPPTKGH